MTPPFLSRLIRPGSARRRRGFTLIEVTIALFVVVVGILPVAALLLGARRLDQQARVQAVAYNAAREQLEILRARSFAGRPSQAVGSNSRPFAIQPSILAEFPNQGLSGDYYVLDYKTTAPRVQQIVVRVRWNRLDRSGVQSFVSLNTLIAEGAGE